LGTLFPQDIELASWNKHRTKKMRMHFRGSRAFRTNQHSAKASIIFNIALCRKSKNKLFFKKTSLDIAANPGLSYD
jgi:hypothetical protein